MLLAVNISDFVQKLGETAVSPNLFNPYSGHSPASQARKQNLTLYLQTMMARQPSVLLVGEAPGHRGCRRTGIPFVSEQVLLAGVQGTGWQLFGESQGYRLPLTEDKRNHCLADIGFLFKSSAHLERAPVSSPQAG